MFGFKNKKSGEIPPDVGQEDEYDASSAGGSIGESVSSDSDISAPVIEGSGNSPSSGGGGVLASDAQLQRIDAKVDSVVEWIKQFYDRFSYMSESIGELRNMNMSNEKSILQITAEAEKVIDSVKDVKPENLRMDYQKIEMKVSALGEKIEGNAQMMKDIIGDMNEFKRKSEIFVGSEGLIKLNEETQKDLIELQKLGSKVRMQADKIQEIFIEVRKGFAESQKIGAMVENLDESYAGLKEALEKLKIDHGNVVRYKDYEDFKKTYSNQLSELKAAVLNVSQLKGNVDELANLVESSLSLARTNKNDIGKIAIKKGVDGVKSISDFDNQISEIVGVIEVLTGKVNEVRKAVGLDKKNVSQKVAPQKVPAARVVVKQNAVPVSDVSNESGGNVAPKSGEGTPPVTSGDVPLKSAPKKQVVLPKSIAQPPVVNKEGSDELFAV